MPHSELELSAWWQQQTQKLAASKAAKVEARRRASRRWPNYEEPPKDRSLPPSLVGKHFERSIDESNKYYYVKNPDGSTDAAMGPCAPSARDALEMVRKYCKSYLCTATVKVHAADGSLFCTKEIGCRG